MTTDAPRARTALPSDGSSPVGTRRIDRTLAFLMSVFGVLFSVQSVPDLVANADSVASPLGLLIVVLFYGVVVLAGLAAVLKQATRAVFLLGGAAYLVCLALWPAALTRSLDPDSVPWLLSVSGVASGFVVVAARSAAVPIVFTLVVGTFEFLFRCSPLGGGLSPFGAALGAAYGVVLSLAVLTLVAAIRLAARAVDRAQGTALGRYADAQIDEATESERVRTDALVHDSVLTTFLSAAGATTPEAQGLAVRMAQNAMHVLSRATVASHTGPRVAVRDLLERVKADASGLGDRFEYGVRDVRDHFVPETVADAVVSAAVQAMTNSVKHAGGPEVPRSVAVHGTEGGGVRVVVEDGGRGFDPAVVASERLGLRVSILERMRRVGGEVDLRTAPGAGTTFVLSWPAAAASAPIAPSDDARAVPA